MNNKPLSSNGPREQPVMYRRNKEQTRPGDQVEAFNRQFLMPEVTALAGNASVNQTQSEVAYRQSRPKKAHMQVRPKKKSKSPSPPQHFNTPKLFTKRTFGNRYCGYCVHDEEPHHHHKSPPSDKKVNTSMSRAKQPRRLKPNLARNGETDDRFDKFTPGRIRASHKFSKDRGSKMDNKQSETVQIQTGVNLFSEANMRKS